MTARIFIDGAAGTTGLEIRQRLAGRRGLSLIALADAARKDPAARKRALNDADVVILCLPDDAAREAVSLIENPDVRVIDASSAHRVAPGWAYGFAELEPGGYDSIRGAKRVSNPGCWATGFLALARPLVRAGILPPEFPVSASGVSGYSGGGKAMIAEFENPAASGYTKTASRIYGLTLKHKHIPEMMQHSGLAHPPLFAPGVGRFYRGMLVELPLALWALPGKPTVTDVQAVLTKAYDSRALVRVASPDEMASIATLDAESMAGTDAMTLYVFGNESAGQARLVAVLDNLGKGAGGAAVQNLNIMMGLAETDGLQA